MRFDKAYLPPEEVERTVVESLTDLKERPDFYASVGMSDPGVLERFVREQGTRGQLWKNDTYTVTIYEDADIEGWPPLLHLVIKRNDRDPIHDWRELQEIKNALVGPENEAVELYPAESRLVDTANSYHLFALADPAARFPFGFAARLVSGETGTTRAKQRPFKEGEGEHGSAR